MSRVEKRAGFSLAAIFALRMLGLFIILPVFSVYAAGLAGGQDAALVGVALGAFGATQALFHIPLGLLSDRIGYKPVIAAGLLIYAAGSFIAAGADSMALLILGRIIQGMGAISAAITALAADLTREQHRTKIMAMIGSTIGLMFAFSLVAAPALYAIIGMTGIFMLTGILALLAIALLYTAVPAQSAHAIMPRTRFIDVLQHRALLRMNFGVFVLHLMQTALWIALPPALVAAGLPLVHHWQVYLPVILLSFIVMVPAIIVAEKKQHLKLIFLMAIAFLIAAQGVFSVAGSVTGLALALAVFFIGFNVMEAMQPSLISRLAPGNAKGAAMGVYNTTQSIGLACGGVIGGWLLKHYGALAVHGLCAVLALSWLILANTMQSAAPNAAAGGKSTHD